MGSLPKDGNPIQINGPIQIHASICKFVVTSAAEAKLGALFYNIQEGTILQLALKELGHLQPPTPVHCDNITAVGIANDTVVMGNKIIFKVHTNAGEQIHTQVGSKIDLGGDNEAHLFKISISTYLNQEMEEIIT